VNLLQDARVALPAIMAKNILVIEDNADIARLVMVNLRSKQLHVDHAAAGVDGLELALTGQYQLVILDLMLPGIDGLDICRTLRREQVYTPVLMLTARTSELDRVLGLEVGADDYLTKPFSVPELVARVNAILRRSDQYQPALMTPANSPLQFGELHVDPDKRQVQLAGNTIELTAREFDLLWHFASNPERVFTRAQLLDSVWGYGHAGYEHTVNSHINRLRAKIEADPAKPRYVITVWGVGYKFSAVESGQGAA
jgi:DNA-binding response OmpR family regulator